MAKPLIQRTREGAPAPQKSPNRIPTEDILSVSGVPGRDTDVVIVSSFIFQFPEIRIGDSWRLIPSGDNILLQHNDDPGGWTTKDTWTP